jgi:hypothetical protein
MNDCELTDAYCQHGLAAAPLRGRLVDGSTFQTLI